MNNVVSEGSVSGTLWIELALVSDSGLAAKEQSELDWRDRPTWVGSTVFESMFYLFLWWRCFHFDS